VTRLTRVLPSYKDAFPDAAGGGIRHDKDRPAGVENYGSGVKRAINVVPDWTRANDQKISRPRLRWNDLAREMKAPSPLHRLDCSADPCPKAFPQFLHFRQYSITPVFGPFQFSRKPAAASRPGSHPATPMRAALNLAAQSAATLILLSQPASKST
jgi:hypothetical protein